MRSKSDLSLLHFGGSGGKAPGPKLIGVFGLILLSRLATLSYADTSAQRDSIQKEDDRDVVTVVAEETCGLATPAQLTWFPLPMQSFAKYLYICPVMLPARKPSLYVLTVDIATLEIESGKAAPKTLETFLRNSEGKRVGTLKYSLFREGPHWSKLIVWSWKAGWPERIVSLIYDDAVSGDQIRDTLFWDAEHHQFVTENQ